MERALRERLDPGDRSIRLRSVIIAIAAVFVVGAAPPAQDVLRVRELLVVDGDGEVRIKANVHRSGQAGIEFLDQGLRRIAIGTGLKGEATIQMFDPEDHLRIASTTFPDGLASVIVMDAGGTTTWSQSSEVGVSLRALLIMWLPLIVILGFWAYLLRRGGVGKQRQLIERSFVHMDKLEAKLDQVIELLARQR